MAELKCDQDDLKCAICLEFIFRTSSSLCGLLEDCSHIFCADCILQLREHRQPGAPDQQCPVCRHCSQTVLIWPKPVLPEEKKRLFALARRAAALSIRPRLATDDNTHRQMITATDAPGEEEPYAATEADADRPDPALLARFRCPFIAWFSRHCRYGVDCPFSHNPAHVHHELSPRICWKFFVDDCWNERLITVSGPIFCIDENRRYCLHPTEVNLMQMYPHLMQ